MKLTSKEALMLIENNRGKTLDDGWINHSICVGNSAGVIANALNLDEDYAKTLGYIHDIGKSVGEFKDHVMNGYNYLKELGYDEKYYNTCLTHSYINNDVMCTAGNPIDIPFRTNFIKHHEYTIYEKIINLCDLMCTSKFVGIEKRLLDIETRRGPYPSKEYHTKEIYKLKKCFDDLLGYDLYDLFPEFKKNNYEDE